MMLAELHAKAAESAQRSPLTWGALQTVISAVASTIIGVVAVLAWTDNRYELRDHSPDRPPDMTLRQEMLAGRTTAQRTSAWITVQLVKNEATAARNRVNDCNVLREKAALTPMERGVCKQYDDELPMAQRRYDDALAEANRLSR
jgi:hypothetical protein